MSVNVGEYRYLVKNDAKLVKKWQIAHKNKEKYTFFAFFFRNIWSYKKKAVPLHSLSVESDVL